MSVYVGNVSYDATEDDIRRLFEDHGTVGRVSLPTDRDTGRVRGFAFVEMADDAEEEAAISTLNETQFMGRQLKVNKARPREDNRGRGGGRRRRY